jgi:hypothetical protein
MAVDSRQQSHHLNGMSYGYAGPHFTNPWGSNQAGSVSSAAYASTQPTSSSLDNQSQIQQRNPLTLPPYNTLPVASTTLASGPSLLAAHYGHPANVTQPQYPQYTASVSAGYQTTAPGFINLPDNRAAAFGFAHNDARRPSHSYGHLNFFMFNYLHILDIMVALMLSMLAVKYSL